MGKPINMEKTHFSVSRATNFHQLSFPLYGHWVSAHCLFSSCAVNVVHSGEIACDMFDFDQSVFILVFDSTSVALS